MSIQQKSISTNAILIIFVCGLIIGFVIGSLAGYGVGLKNVSKNNINNNTNSSAEVNADTASTNNDTNNVVKKYAESKQKYSQKGVITSIENDKIAIRGQVIENNQLVEKDFTILIDDNTQFKKIIIATPDKTTEDIELKDLDQGDEITALSKDQEDIKGKTEFTARQINFYINKE